MLDFTHSGPVNTCKHCESDKIRFKYSNMNGTVGYDFGYIQGSCGLLQKGSWMDGEHLKILIVDDDTAHSEAISRTLKASYHDIDIQTAGSLQECRRAVIAEPPDILLIDMNLPDGRATEILANPVGNRTFPLLIMTTCNDKEMAMEAMKAGALDYIVKSPETFAVIPQTVERALKEWRSHQKYLQT